MLEHQQSSVKETQKHSKSTPKRTYSFLPLLSKAFTIKRKKKKNRKDFIFTSFYLQQCLFEIPLQGDKKSNSPLLIPVWRKSYKLQIQKRFHIFILWVPISVGIFRIQKKIHIKNERRNKPPFNQRTRGFNAGSISASAK